MWVYGPRHVYRRLSASEWMGDIRNATHKQQHIRQVFIYLFFIFPSILLLLSFLLKTTTTKKKRRKERDREEYSYIFFLWLGISPCAGWWASAKFACSGIKRKKKETKKTFFHAAAPAAAYPWKKKIKGWSWERRRRWWLYVGFYFYEWERGTHRSVSFQEARAQTERIE